MDSSVIEEEWAGVISAWTSLVWFYNNSKFLCSQWWRSATKIGGWILALVLGYAFLWEQNSGRFTAEKKNPSLDITWGTFSAFHRLLPETKKAKRFVIYTGNLVCCINNLKYDVLYDLGTCYITMRVFTFTYSQSSINLNTLGLKMERQK